MTHCYTRVEVVLMLLDECKRLGSQKAFAEYAGVSDAFLSDVLNGRREPTDRLLGAIAMERRTVFVRRISRDADVLTALNGTAVK